MSAVDPQGALASPSEPRSEALWHNDDTGGKLYLGEHLVATLVVVSTEHLGTLVGF